MTKTRKTLIITFLIIGSVLILLSFLTRLGNWSDFTYCVFAFGGFLFATTALIITMIRTKAK